MTTSITGTLTLDHEKGTISFEPDAGKFGLLITNAVIPEDTLSIAITHTVATVAARQSKEEKIREEISRLQAAIAKEKAKKPEVLYPH